MTGRPAPLLCDVADKLQRLAYGCAIPVGLDRTSGRIGDAVETSAITSPGAFGPRRGFLFRQAKQPDGCTRKGGKQCQPKHS